MVNPAVGGVGLVRNLLAQGLSESLSGTTERVRVSSLPAPPDPPGVILRRSGPLSLFEQVPGTFCVFEVPFEVLLLAGPAPGSDGATQLLDAWVERLAQVTVLDVCVGYDDWPARLAKPVVESIDEEQIFDVHGVQLFGCTAQIITQVDFGINQGE